VKAPSHRPQRQANKEVQKSNQQQHDNKMAATANNSGPVLLRRPLPPVQKNKEQISGRKLPTKNGQNFRGAKDDSMRATKSPERHSTLQKTAEILRQNDKLKEYERRIALQFAYRKPRGGDPFPMRKPKKALDIDYNAFIDDSYEPPPPLFRLNDFLKFKERYEDVKTVNDRKVVSHFIEKPLITWHVYESKVGGVKGSEKGASCQHIVLDEIAELPEIEQRVPFRQQIIEEKAYLLEHYSAKINDDLSKLHEDKPQKGLVVAQPMYQTGEKTVYINEGDEISKAESQRGDDEAKDQRSLQLRNLCAVHNGFLSTKKASSSPALSTFSKGIKSNEEAGEDAENFEGESVVFNSPPLFFQGELSARSPSPFEIESDQAISPVELAVLQCIRLGGTKLILKAHFIDQLPDMSQISTSLAHINLSFNNFESIPEELLEIPNLEILKLRNNPIRVIPEGISQLTKLRNFVLSFCRLTSLPQSLFQLSNLEKLDISYNEIAFIPEELSNLRSLEVLNLEGNRLASLPSGIVLLSLRSLNVANTFTHHLFWRSVAPPQPQNLVEICATVLAKQGRLLDIEPQDTKLKNMFAAVSSCGYCRGPKFGRGLPVIKPLEELFGVKNLPILFYVCSQDCRSNLARSTEYLLTPEPY